MYTYVDLLDQLETGALRHVDQSDPESENLRTAIESLIFKSSPRLLLQYICEVFSDAVSDTPSLLILSNVHVMESLGVCHNDIYCFIDTLQKMVSSFSGCSLISLSEFSRDASVLAKSIHHQSHVILRTMALSSGYSCDVHGQFEMIERNPTQETIVSDHCKKLQYKVQDFAVKFFAPGTSSAVL